MGVDSELEKHIQSLLGIQEEKTFIPNPLGVHFTEYNVQSKDAERISQYAKKLNRPTDREYEEYAIKRAKQEEELQKRIKENEKYGPAFLSDEWRWARIDAEVERCREYINKYG